MKPKTINAALRRNGITGFRKLLFSKELQGRALMELYPVQPEYREKLELFIENGKYRNCVILRILKKPEVLDAIDRIGIEKFSILLDRDGFEFQVRGSDKAWVTTVNGMLKNQGFIMSINIINAEKLQVVFGTNVSMDMRIIYYLQVETVVNSIIELDIKILTVLRQAKSYTVIDFMAMLWYRFITALNLISAEKLELLVEHYGTHFTQIIDLARSIPIMRFICDVDVEKLIIVLQFFELHYYALELFMKAAHAKSLNGIDTKKLIFLLGCYFYARSPNRFLELVNHPQLVNSLSFEEVKVVFSVIGNFELLNIIRSTEFDVRKHLSFAVALYKKGVISTITFKYVSDANALYEDVIKAFPDSFPIRKLLERPTGITSFPKLQDRCVAFYVEHCNKIKST